MIQDGNPEYYQYCYIVVHPLCVLVTSNHIFMTYMLFSSIQFSKLRVRKIKQLLNVIRWH